MLKAMRWGVAGLMMLSGGAFAAGDMGSSFDAAVEGDFKEAISTWKGLADSGDAQAQFNLALMYHGGVGMPHNETEAVKLYHQAAEGGYRPAQVYLVVAYEEGWFGLPQDDKKAYYWRGLLGK